MKIDTDYLTRIEKSDMRALLHEPKFLAAQKLFFSVTESLGGSIDFEIADMREVHAIASIMDDIKGKRILDVGCGSVESYVLNDDFRDRYPPFFAEMAIKLGADVTGIDIRENPKATYDHRACDLTDPSWTKEVDAKYDVIACLSLFNAPESPFEHDEALCDRVMDEMHHLLADDGILIVTLRDEIFTDTSTQAKDYVEAHGFTFLHCHGNCVWAGK